MQASPTTSTVSRVPAAQGYDIGADEFLNAGISASLAALPDPVAAGEKLTYIAQVINTGDVAVVVTIQLDLPDAITPEGQVLWENVNIAPWRSLVQVTWSGRLQPTIPVHSTPN